MGLRDIKLNMGHTQYLAISTHIEEVLVEQKSLYSPVKLVNSPFFLSFGVMVIGPYSGGAGINLDQQ